MSSDGSTYTGASRDTFDSSRRFSRQSRRDRSCLHQRPITSAVNTHPVYNPDRVTCSFCKAIGHSLMNCFARMRHHHEMIDLKCKHGYHKPHLHDHPDLFRCEWCLTHLHSDYVRIWYPREYDYEKEKIAEELPRNLARYAESGSD